MSFARVIKESYTHINPVYSSLILFCRRHNYSLFVFGPSFLQFNGLKAPEKSQMLAERLKKSSMITFAFRLRSRKKATAASIS